jgi:hypothetical protein
VETPDRASIGRFRQTIDKLGLSGGLLTEVNRRLDALGFVIKRGTGSVAPHRAAPFGTRCWVDPYSPSIGQALRQSRQRRREERMARA